MIPSPLDAVIFDMDGLLLDTETVFQKASIAACEDLGYVMDDALFLSMVGNPPDVNHDKLRARFGEDFPVERYYAASHGHFEAACADGGAGPRPGAPELLAMLQSLDVPCAVATSSSAGYARANLDRAGLLDYFRAIVTRGDVTRGKPHPDTFLEAARRLRARPAHCLALEDSHNGVRAAAAAGMATVMVPDLLAAEPDIAVLCTAVVETLHAVAADIRRLHAAGLLKTKQSPGG